MDPAQTPMGGLFQMYILDIMRALPPERAAAIEKLNLPKVLNTKATDWRGAIKEKLHLSETFPIAVWDIWLRNREQLGEKAVANYPVEAYARDFVREFLKEGSQIDHWPGDSLEQAKARLARHRVS